MKSNWLLCLLLVIIISMTEAADESSSSSGGPDWGLMGAGIACLVLAVLIPAGFLYYSYCYLKNKGEKVPEEDKELPQDDDKKKKTAWEKEAKEAEEAQQEGSKVEQDPDEDKVEPQAEVSVGDSNQQEPKKEDKKE